MSPKLVINTFRENAKTKSEKLGNLELKYISIGDIEFIDKKLRRIENHREFVSRLIHHQLVIPQITYTKFKDISEDELKKVARDFINYEKYTFKYFKETSDDEFFQNFRRAFQRYHKEESKKLLASFRPIIRSNTILDGFKKQYAGIIQKTIQPTSFVSELFKDYSVKTRQISESQLKVTKSLMSAIEPYHLTARIVTEAIKPQINLWQEWTQRNRRLFEGFNSYWKSFHDKYKITEQEAIRVLKKYKWFVSPSLPIAFVFEVVKIGRKKGNHRGEINRLFVEYVRSNNYEELNALVNNWQSNNILKPRLKIFRDCIDGLRNASSGSNPSNFVLPTLIAQIDGILQEYMEKHGCVKERKWKDSSGNEIDWKDFYRNITPNQDLDELANEIFMNILFQRSQRGIALDTPFTFNRHKIMHGEYLRYGRIDNTIRAFLVLDFLASLK